MVYTALTGFLRGEPLISIDPDIPEADRTPQYLADLAGYQWSMLGAKDLSAKLLPIFAEFNRLCEAEKARKGKSDE